MRVTQRQPPVRKFFKHRSIWMLVYTIYISFILLSVYAFVAQDSVDTVIEGMDEKYDYNLKFDHDGKTTHYDVTRHTTSLPGKITLTYWTAENKLDVTEVSNIKTLTIDVKSMFEDEVEKVYKHKQSELPTIDMDYWLDAGDGVFTVEFDIDNSEPLESLTFTKFPTPKSVLVNNQNTNDQEWWGGTNYSILGNSITISSIPTGSTTVTLYFKEANQPPVASFITNPANYAGVNENISFDGSASYDPDTADHIKSWIWDFGDNNYQTGKTTSHQYSTPGNYTIRLTVRDNAEPPGENWVEKTITVAYGAEEDNDNDGLRDRWEWEHFGSLNEDETGDPDFDGATNKEEQDAGTNPKDPESKPQPVKEGEDEPAGEMDMTLIIIVVIIVVILILVFMFVFRSKKAKVEEKERDEEAIAAMEEKIKRAKKLGLPTRELERILEDVKDGKPLAVEPMKSKKGKDTGKHKTQQKGKGRSGGKSSSKRRR